MFVLYLLMLKLRDIINQVTYMMIIKSLSHTEPVLGEKRDKLKEAKKVAFDDMLSIGAYIPPELDNRQSNGK